ncbi:MAG: YihY/virulence factor BrkB family protein [Clostridia bacterium]|nr:YihY/virulence factor BrkB family protein [Clostridia bacterium]
MSKFIKDLIKVYKEDRINILSGYASFFITISAVPFIALVFFVLGKLSPNLVDSFENLISTIVPQGLLNGFNSIIEQIKVANAKILLPISIITALWASCKGTGGLARGIEHVYKKDREYTFFSNIFINIYRTVIFTALIILSLIVFSIGDVLVANIKTDSYAMNILFQILLKLRFVAYLAFLVLIFDILYRRLSGVKGLLNHLPGAIFTSVGWTVFTAIYSVYISFVLGKPSVYLGMGTLVFFMLWIYFLVMIVLIGSAINKLYIERK